MDKVFLIQGSIVPTDDMRDTYEDTTPAQVASFLNGLEPGQGIVIELDSWGGDLTAAISICNLLKKAASENHPTTAHIIGVAASSASLIACSCQKLVMDSNSLMCIHLPWTVVQGNQEELAKESQVLSNYTQGMISVYKNHFSATDEQIYKWLSDETWIFAEAAYLFDLDVEIIPTKTERRYAASMKGLKKFNHIPKAIMERLDMENKEEIEDEITTTTEETTTEETEVQAATVETVTGSDNQADETDEGKTVEEPETTDAVMVPKAEADKRVSGMQSTMQAKINSLVKDYEAKISDFTNQLKTKDEELNSVKAELTSLTSKLEAKDSQIAELSDRTSAVLDELDRKNDALQKLNGAVNTPKCSDEIKPWKKLQGEALIQWCRANPNAR